MAFNVPHAAAVCPSEAAVGADLSELQFVCIYTISKIVHGVHYTILQLRPRTLLESFLQRTYLPQL